jgi:hypothetical protein
MTMLTIFGRQDASYWNERYDVQGKLYMFDWYATYKELRDIILKHSDSTREREVR